MSLELLMKLSIIGSGYVGLVSGACFAEVGHNVICVDNDQAKSKASRPGTFLFTNPASKNSYSVTLPRAGSGSPTASRMAWINSQVVFIAVPTPPQTDGSVDLSYIERVAREIAGVLKPGQYRVVVDKSTVPVKTGDKVDDTIKRYGKAGASSTW